MPHWIGAFVAALAVALSPEAAAQQRTEASEASIKAAFLFKFAAYVEWAPATFESPAAPLVIGVADADEVAAELARIAAGRTIASHPVAVRRIVEGDSMRGVDLLFVGREAARPAQLIRAAQQSGALTVTESDRGLEQGSAINFVSAGEHVGFEVSLDAAAHSGHKISSRMLGVARRVVGKPG